MHGREITGPAERGGPGEQWPAYRSKMGLPPTDV